MTINAINHVLPLLLLRDSIGGGLAMRGSDGERGGTGFNGSVSRGSFGSGLFGSAILFSWVNGSGNIHQRTSAEWVSLPVTYRPSTRHRCGVHT